MKTRANKGFTLIEVIVAVSIIASSIIVVSSTWSGNLLRIRKSTLNNNVASLLERKMVEIETKYHGVPLEEIPDAEAGDFGSDFPQYSWTFASQDFEMPDLTPVLVGREGGADEMLINIIKQTQEFISKSVKEVTVSVIVKLPKRKKAKNPVYSITTYFVDYNQELSIGPGAEAGQ